MNPVILFRPDIDTESELAVARRHMLVYSNRSMVPPSSLVIGRYSVLPYYRELAQDLSQTGSRLINTPRQHEYIADLGSYYEDLSDLTPRTWRRLEDLPEKGPFVLKGQTNSKKHLWRTHMYAETKREAVDVWLRLKEDFLLGQQHIYIREFVQLNKLMDGLNGQPVTEEYRFFCLRAQITCWGFYWSSYVDDLPEVPRPSRRVLYFAQRVLERLWSKAPFVVVDIGVRPNGDPVLIELNDAQMSGPSEVNPYDLYRGLARQLQPDPQQAPRQKG